MVVEQEWSLLGQHKSGEQASAAVRAIREDIQSFQPNTLIEKAVYGSELAQVSNLFATRRARLDAATAGGVPPILIAGLIVLVGLILLAIPYVGLLKGRHNLLSYGVFAAFLIATMFFIVDVNNPFAGTVPCVRLRLTSCSPEHSCMSHDQASLTLQSQCVWTAWRCR